MNDEPADYWRGYRDAVEQMRAILPQPTPVACTCPRVWNGVIPPSCAIHPPRQQFNITCTTTAYPASPSDIEWSQARA